MKYKRFKVVSKVTDKCYWVYEVWKRSKNETLYLIHNQGQWQYWDAKRFKILYPNIVIRVEL